MGARTNLGKESHQKLFEDKRRFAMRMMIAIIKFGGQLTVPTGPIVGPFAALRREASLRRRKTASCTATAQCPTHPTCVTPGRREAF